MLHFYEKRSWRAIVKSWGFVSLVTFICVFMMYVVYDRYTIEREMAGRRIEAEKGLAELESRKEIIKDKVEYLGSERGVEAEMRRNFDVAQPGEQVVIIVDPEEDTKVEEMPALPPKQDTPPWYIFWR